MDLAGASVLITGASSGIGAALAVALDEHHPVLGLVGRDQDRLDHTASACPDASVHQWALDLGDLDDVDRLADEAWDALGGVDVLVNNAAMPKRRHLLALTDDEIEQVMRVNFHSPVRLARRLLPRMIERGRGLVVNVSSFGGRAGIANETAYSASKFALTGWSESARLDLWHEPVDVLLITPGAIDTAIWDRPGNDAPHFDVDKASAESVARDVIAAITDDGPFETYTPDLSGIVQFKFDDIDTFHAGTIAAVTATGDAS